MRPCWPPEEPAEKLILLKVQSVVLVPGNDYNIIRRKDIPNSAVASQRVHTKRHGSTKHQWHVSMPERAGP